MQWFAVLPVALVALAVLVLPGFAIVLASGVRWVSALLLAPAVSVAVVAIASVGAGMLDATWGILPILATTLASVAGALAVRWAFRIWRGSGTARDDGGSPPTSTGSVDLGWLPLLAAGVAALLVAVFFVLGVRNPANFSQTFDNIFHLNAIQWVAQEGDASPLTLTRMTSGDEAPYFYPSVWHAIAGLVAKVTGARVAVAANAVNLVIAAVVWPLSATALLVTVWRLRRSSAVLAGVCFAGFSGFPFLLMDYGVLYPNFLSYALVPGVLAVAATFFGSVDIRIVGPCQALIVAGLGSIGVALAHPTGAMLVLAMVVPILIGAAWRTGHRLLTAEPRPWVRIAVLGAGIIAVAWCYVQVWTIVRPPYEASRWPARESPPQAIGEILSQSAYGRPAAYGVGLLALVGAWWLMRKRLRGRWLVASWALVAALFIIVAAFPETPFRDALTQVWYNNAPRLAAALPLVAAPIAAIGASVTWTAALRWVREVRTVGRRLVLAVAVLAFGATVYGTISFNATWLDWSYSQDGPLINHEELALIEQLPDLVPQDARLAVEPYLGGSLAYGLAGIDVTHRHVLDGVDNEVALIDAELRNATPGSPVCEAIAQEGVTHVLDFSGREVHNGRNTPTGFLWLSKSEAVELVAEVGGAKLYEIVGCG